MDVELKVSLEEAVAIVNLLGSLPTSQGAAIAVSNGGTSNAATTMSFALSESGIKQGWLRRYRDGSANTEIGFSDALLFTGNVTGTKAERARIDTSGNLGIGTSSPAQKLSVQGGLTVTGSATLPAAQGPLLFSFESPVGRCYIGDGTGYSFAFSKRTASTTTDLVTLTDTGNLGIGTTSPAQRVHNVGNYRQNDATNSYGFELQNGTGTSRLVTISGGSSFAIQTGGNAIDYLGLDGNGNITAGAGALATTATNGFLYVPTCAGTPTGTPTAKSGYAPIVVNTTNNKLYFYSGGAWRDAGP